MKNSRLAVLTICLAALALPGLAGAAKAPKETFTSGGRERAYFLAVPPKLDPGKPVPLVILLHGSDRDGLSLVEKWQSLAETEGFLAVGPNARHPAYWSAVDDGPEFLHDIVEHLRAKYSIDPRRVYLFGHSGGAGFALQMGCLESRYFAAVALHAGSFINGEEKWLPTRATRKIPFHIAVGDRDPAFPLAVVSATRDALKDQGFPVELEVMPNHDHWYYTLAPKINRTAWTFLAAHPLAEDPVFEERELK